MRFFVYDLKRIFSGKALVALCLISPILVILIFSSIVSPMIFTAKSLKFNLAICDEDKSPAVGAFITQMVNAQALKDLIVTYPVSSAADGKALIARGDVSVLVRIPAGLFDDMRTGSPVKVQILATDAHAFEANLVTMALESALEIDGKSQNVMEAASLILIDKGVSESDAESYLSTATDDAITRYMNRRQVFGNASPVSPVGEYLPVEYYIGAIFALFAALAMLPLIHFSAVDASGAILRRGLLCGIGTARFFAARLLSGAIFVLLVLSMLFPASLFLKLAGTVLGGSYADNFAALVLTLPLSALCFSAFALAIAVWLPNENTALWTGFFLVLGMAALGGALVPEGALAPWAAACGRFLPLRAVMRTLALSLFRYDRALFLRELLRLLGFTALLLPLGFWGLKRRGRTA